MEITYSYLFYRSKSKKRLENRDKESIQPMCFLGSLPRQVKTNENNERKKNNEGRNGKTQG
jgi:hypothetical protein